MRTTGIAGARLFRECAERVHHLFVRLDDIPVQGPGDACPIHLIGATTNFGYDPVGDQTSATQANGAGTTYAYDQAGRITAVTQQTARCS